MSKTNKQNYTMILFAIISAVFVVCIDVGIVSPARTTIASSLHATDAQSVWIMTTYSLAFAASMLIWAILSDKYGKRKVLVITISMFAVSSILCGLTNSYHSFALMLGARAIQGFFAGGIIPSATAYIATEFPIEKKGVAMGLVGTSFAIGNIVGPTAGSALIDWLGHDNWGWLFYVNIFFGAISVPMILKYLNETELQKDLKLEVFSILCSSASIVSIMLFFTNVDFSGDVAKSFSHLDVWLPIVTFVVFGVLTVVLTGWLKGPLYIIKDLFKNRTFVLSIVSSCVVALSLFSISMYLPQISETFFRLNEGKGGYFSTIIGVGGVIFGPIGGKMIGKLGPKKLLQLFAVVELAGVTLFYFTLLNDWHVAYYISLFVIGSAQSAIIGLAYNFFIQIEVDKKMQASAQSILALFRSMFGAIAPTISIIFLKNAIKNTKNIGKEKGKAIAKIIKDQYKNIISHDMTAAGAKVKAVSETKAKALMMSGKATPQSMAAIQSDAKNTMAKELVNATNHAKSLVHIPKFNNDTCNNLHAVSAPLRKVVGELCVQTRHSMLGGFATIALTSVIGVVILLVISNFFKNYDMKALMSKPQAESNDEEKRTN